ncbi:MAG TPA: hypothetical protein PLH79_16785 [bacterium]|nr:hypothetical protein [Candidatus Omnitrophota bacterium]HOL96008.1 hypothetical protein [bacterium]HPP02863.1 hypothetical protein [bacterium]
MKRIALLACVIGITLACSKNPGELVDKPPEAATPASVSQAGLPAGHPPLGGASLPGQNIPGLTSALSPGPAPEPVVEGTTVTAASLVFTIDPAWKIEPPKSSMRAAQFRVPAKEGASGDGELAIFQGIGGSAEDNIQRWIAQMANPEGEPVIETKQVGPLSVQLLDVTGSFTDTMMGGGTGQPLTGYRMLAAVVEGHPMGPWHFKLIGPKETLEQAKPAFEALIASLKPAQ